MRSMWGYDFNFFFLNFTDIGDILNKKNDEKINIVIDTDKIKIKTQDHKLSVFLLGWYRLFLYGS